MRFSTLSLCSFLLSSRSVAAWVAPLRHSSRSSVTRLQSAVEEKTSMAVSLKPEYEAAYEQTVDAIEKSMPEDKRNLLPMLSHFALEYLKASQTAYAAGQTENTDPVATSKRFLEGIGYGMKYGMPNSPDHYTFDVTHEALRGIPEKEDGNEVDYYAFGCDFFRPCMDISDPDKCVLGQDNLLKAMKQLEAGENVVFLANHQSEADPQVVSCCLEAVGQKKAAEDMIYVAGHKVTTDPLAIPFSMGRNLICIHSKKHINADAETKPRKQKQNLKAMNALLKALKKGGSLVWVAPSGGRDRRNVETGEVPLAPFDSKTIDMFRLMGNKSKVPTHYYTLAMVSYELCPPPDHVVAGTGEERNVRFVPVGIAVGDEVPSVGGLEKRHEFCEHAMAQCQADYEKLAKSLESLHQ